MKKRYAMALLTAGLAAAAALTIGRAQSGVSVTIACGAVGQELDLCKKAAGEWAKKTGNTASVLETPALTNDRLAYYQQQLSAESPDIDVYQIDVIHPGILGNSMVDLKQYFTPTELKKFNQGIIANNTVGGRLTAIPWFTDGGLLFYRTDLLAKYKLGIPKTWPDLFAAAKTVQAGERKTNKTFYGFVFQGNAYEGLTCDALEWINSNGGGTIIDAKGNITINNPKAAATLDLIAANAKLVSPPDITTYDEEKARAVFQSGNALFMRNWLYAYALGNQKDAKTGRSPVIAGKFAVTPLPAAVGNKNVGTVGGWQLAVSKFSKNPKESADLVRYLTSEAVQKDRALVATEQPTIPTLYNDPEINKVYPFFKNLSGRNPVTRPSTVTGAKYNEVSTAFWNAVHAVLTGKKQGAGSLADLEKELTKIKGAGW